MGKRYISIWIFLLVAFTGPLGLAQQDPLVTNSHFDILRYNPAYAGAHDHLALQLLYRAQWLGLEGAPRTYSFSAHAPLRTDRVGVGLVAWHDQIGADQRTGISLDYAYRFPLNKKLKLAVGIQAGLEQFNTDLSALNLQDYSDGAFLGLNYSWTLPAVGTGLYLHSELFYIGLSVPQMIPHQLIPEVNAAGTYRYVQHIYLTGGAMLQLADDWKARPSFIFRSILPGTESRAPWMADINGAILYQDLIWAGVIGRFNWPSNIVAIESFDVWMAIQLEQGLRVGASYDLRFGALSANGRSSIELLLGYEFDLRTRKVAMPSYF